MIVRHNRLPFASIRINRHDVAPAGPRMAPAGLPLSSGLTFR